MLAMSVVRDPHASRSRSASLCGLHDHGLRSSRIPTLGPVALVIMSAPHPHAGTRTASRATETVALRRPTSSAAFDIPRRAPPSAILRRRHQHAVRARHPARETRRHLTRPVIVIRSRCRPHSRAHVSTFFRTCSDPVTVSARTMPGNPLFHRFRAASRPVSDAATHHAPYTARPRECFESRRVSRVESSARSRSRGAA